MKVLKIGIIIFLLILISSPGLGSGLGSSSNTIREGFGFNFNQLVKKEIESSAKAVKVSETSAPIPGFPGLNIPGLNIPGLTQTIATKGSKSSEPTPIPIKSAYEIEKDIMIKYMNTPIGSANFLIDGEILNPCYGLYHLHDNPVHAIRGIRDVYLKGKYISRIFGSQDDDFINILNTTKNHPILDYMIRKDLLKLNKQILASNAKLPPEITKAMIEKLVRDGQARLNKYRYEII